LTKKEAAMTFKYNLFLGVTTDDGSVSTATFNFDTGSWFKFSPIAALSPPAVANSNVAVERLQILSPDRTCAIDATPAQVLRYVASDIGPSPKVVATNAGQVRVRNQSPANALGVLALTGPTLANWSFGLRPFLIDPSGTAHPFVDQTQRFNPGPIDPSDPGSAFDVNGLQLVAGAPPGFRICLATGSGGLYYLDTYSGILQFVDVKQTAAGDPGNVVSVSCSGRGEVLHVCVVNDAGKILHTTRRFADGTWLPWGSVNDATGSKEVFSQAAISAHGDEVDLNSADDTLHLAAVTTSGGLLHSIRTGALTADPVWSPFVDLESAAAAGDPGTVTYADIYAFPENN
jgi:hypothetical protein